MVALNDVEAFRFKLICLYNKPRTVKMYFVEKLYKYIESAVT